MRKEIMLSKEWLLNSGIQNTEGPRAGGFNSWFDPAAGGYSYVYSEITGYGITTLLFLADVFREDEYTNRAALAAEWLISKAMHPCGGVRTRDYYRDMAESDHYAFASDNIYAFDNGMVLYGLICLYEKTRDRKWLQASIHMADFLLGRMKRDGGLFYAVYNAATGELEDSPRKWSTQSGSYHAKLALGFTDLYEASRDQRYRDAAMDLCRASLPFQDASGRFITSRDDSSTHLHPHCYAAEGLLYAGAHFDDSGFVESAARAARWALDNQLEDGGIPKFFDGKKFNTNCRSDILAQVLRLGALLRGMGRLGEEYSPRLVRLRKKLLSFQHANGGRQDGGFSYGATLDGVKKEHLNSWCTMFAVQALVMHERLASGKTKPDLRYLI